MGKKRRFGGVAFTANRNFHGEAQSHKTMPSPNNQLPKAAPQSRSLFHYTNAEGLVGILENQTLHATHSNFLNDSTECKSILAVLLPTIEAELREVVPRLVEEKVFDRAILTDYGDEIYVREAEKMLQAMILATDRTAPFFITSFCIHDIDSPAFDHGLLSQWRGYARGGFAIEFDEQALDGLNQKERDKFRYQGLLTEKVTYRNHSEEVSPEKFGGLAGALLKSLFPKVSSKLTEILGSKSTVDFAGPFLSIAPFLKNANFEEENEYRIVALCNRPTKVESNDRREVKTIKFRPKPNGELIPFIALYEGLSGKLPIKGIILGPHQQQQSRRMALEILLEKCGLDIPIKVSEIPFRG